MGKKKVSSKSCNAYGVGCSRGRDLADQWTANPNRSKPSVGGTLQYVILDLAKRFKEAISDEEMDSIRGEIVGFSYRIECPEDSLKCAESARRRTTSSANPNTRSY